MAQKLDKRRFMACMCATCQRRPILATRYDNHIPPSRRLFRETPNLVRWLLYFAVAASVIATGIVLIYT